MVKVIGQLQVILETGNCRPFYRQNQKSSKEVITVQARSRVYPEVNRKTDQEECVHRTEWTTRWNSEIKKRALLFYIWLSNNQMYGVLN